MEVPFCWDSKQLTVILNFKWYNCNQVKTFVAIWQWVHLQISIYTSILHGYNTGQHYFRKQALQLIKPGFNLSISRRCLRWWILTSILTFGKRGLSFYWALQPRWYHAKKNNFWKITRKENLFACPTHHCVLFLWRICRCDIISQKHSKNIEQKLL